MDVPHLNHSHHNQSNGSIGSEDEQMQDNVSVNNDSGFAHSMDSNQNNREQYELPVAYPEDYPENVTVQCQPIKWRKVVSSEGSVPRPRHGHRAIVVADSLVVWGGGNEGIVDDLSVYSFSLNRWQIPHVRGELPPGTAAAGLCRRGAQAVAYMFGGMIEYGMYSNDIYELDMCRWEWKRLRPRARPPNGTVPCPRLGHSMVYDQSDDTIYIFGGLTNNSEEPRQNKPKYLDDLYCINLKNKQYNDLHWDAIKTSGPTPSARESHTAIIYEKAGRKEMIVYGGMNGNRLGDVWVLDLITMQWREQYITGSPPLPRSLHTATLVDNRMFIFGGWVPVTPISDIGSSADHKWKCTASLAALNLDTWTWEYPGPDFVENYDGIGGNDQSGPRARSGHCAALTDGGRLYVWSGRDGYRKAWNNQVCCRDMWFLETEKPQKPARVSHGKVGLQTLEASWQISKNAEAYLVQVCKQNTAVQPPMAKLITPASGTRPMLQVVKNPATGNVQRVVKVPGGKELYMGVQEGVPTTSAQSALPQGDPIDMPENFMEDQPEEKGPEESTSSQPPELKPEQGQGQEKSSGEPEEEEEWYDVAIVKGTNLTVTKYYLPEEFPKIGVDYDRDFVDWTNHPSRQSVDLQTGTSYKLRVAGLNSLGQGEFTDPMCFKTSIPGFPGAPSQIKIQKVPEGATVAWESPSTQNGTITEYSVYLAIKASADPVKYPTSMRASLPSGTGVEFMRVYCGADNNCFIDQTILGDAHVEIGLKNKPAIIFRIAARNDKGYGPATQVRWLQDSMNSFEPPPSGAIRSQAGGYNDRSPLQTVRAPINRPSHQSVAMSAVRGQVVRPVQPGVRAPQVVYRSAVRPDVRYQPYTAPSAQQERRMPLQQTPQPQIQPPHRQLQQSNRTNAPTHPQ